MTNTYDTTVVQELFGSPNLIVQKRKDFFVSFPFLSIDEAKQKLHDLSHNPDEEEAVVEEENENSELSEISLDNNGED